MNCTLNRRTSRGRLAHGSGVEKVQEYYRRSRGVRSESMSLEGRGGTQPVSDGGARWPATTVKDRATEGVGDGPENAQGKPRVEAADGGGAEQAESIDTEEHDGADETDGIHVGTLLRIASSASIPEAGGMHTFSATSCRSFGGAASSSCSPEHLVQRSSMPCCSCQPMSCSI